VQDQRAGNSRRKETIKELNRKTRCYAGEAAKMQSTPTMECKQEKKGGERKERHAPSG